MVNHYRIISISFLIWLMIFLVSHKADCAEMKGKIVFTSDSVRILHIIHLNNPKTWEDPITIDMSKSNVMFYAPTWNKEGSCIIFNSYDNDKRAVLKSINLENLSTQDIDNSIIETIPDNIQKSFGDPRISPNEKYMAVSLFEYYQGNRLGIYHVDDKKLLVAHNLYLSSPPFFWTADSNNILLEATESTGGTRKICIYNIQNETYKVLAQGHSPAIDSKNMKVIFSGNDGNLYSVNIQNGSQTLIDTGNWSMTTPIGVSNDGNYYYYIGGSGWLPPEKLSIFAFDLCTRKRTRISKKYPLLPWGSLHE